MERRGKSLGIQYVCEEYELALASIAEVAANCTDMTRSSDTMMISFRSECRAVLELEYDVGEPPYPLPMTPWS